VIRSISIRIHQINIVVRSISIRIHQMNSDTFNKYQNTPNKQWYVQYVSLFIWCILILIERITMFIWCILILIERITMIIWCILILIVSVRIHQINSDTLNKYQNTPNKHSDMFNKYRNTPNKHSDTFNKYTPNKQWYVQVYSDTYWTYHCLFGVFWYLLKVSLCLFGAFWYLLNVSLCLFISIRLHPINSDTFNKYQITTNKQWYVQ
jgi:hypothetical protein